MSDDNVAFLDPFEMNGVTWTVTVTGTGQFTATADGFRPVTGYSYQQLTERAAAAVRDAKVKVEVPYAYIANGKFRYGVATGIHAGTGNVTVLESGKRSQLANFRDGYYNRDFIQVPSSEDAAEMLRLNKVASDARALYNGLLERYAFPGGSLRRAVTDAIREARIKQELEDSSS